MTLQEDLTAYTKDFLDQWTGNTVNPVTGQNVNMDGRYGIQCMDLFNLYRFGLGCRDILPTPDAASVWELNNDPGCVLWEWFDGITPDQPARFGDVFIYNRYAWHPNGGGPGHIGVVVSDNADSITVLETNGLADGYEDDNGVQYGSPPRIHTWPKTNLYGFLRPIKMEDTLPTAAEDITITAINGAKVSLADVVNSIDAKLTGLLSTELADPDDPKTSYPLATWIVWGATNAKHAAGNAATAAQRTDPTTLARTVHDAAANLVAGDLAAHLQVTAK